MGDTRTFARSFGGGEVTPEFFGRLDDVKFQTGLARCRNFMVAPHGPIENRPGTQFVREVKASATRTRTIPFVYGFGQSLIIEISVGVFRFHAEGQTILSAGVPYEVAHTYAESELFDITYAQSGDVVKLAHRNHPRRSLSRLGVTNWTLADLATGPALSPPTGVTGTAHAGATPGTAFNTDYVVTALTGDLDESLQSATVTISNNLYADGAYSDVSWSATTGAQRYNVYKKAAGLFGYIGQTDQLTFRDDNIAPDLGATPPIDTALFVGAGNYPGAVGYYDQRAVWAGSTLQPQNVNMSRAGTENNFNYSIPVKDDDSIQFKLASRENNAILHVVPMSDLIILTPAAVWKISGGLSEVITPNTLVAREQTYVGSSTVKPLKIGNNLIYVAARGGHLREFGYDGQRTASYISGDISIRAPHLFDEDTVVSMTQQLAPYPIAWAVMRSGLLVGLTYIPEQDVGAFHWHDTDGFFEDATTIYEQGRDVTYFVVRRTIGGVQKRYIERFAKRRFAAVTDQFFVDCGATFTSGSPVSSVSGVGWLNGKTVSILADGAVVEPQVVTGGVLTLPAGITARVITFGLGYVSDAKTLPMSMAQVPGFAQGQPKNVNQVYLRVYRSSGIFVGPTFEELTEAKQRTIEPMGSPPSLKTEEIEVVIKGAWTDDGAVCVRQSDPLALTVVSMVIDAAIGGG